MNRQQVTLAFQRRYNIDDYHLARFLTDAAWRGLYEDALDISAAEGQAVLVVAGRLLAIIKEARQSRGALGLAKPRANKEVGSAD